VRHSSSLALPPSVTHNLPIIRPRHPSPLTSFPALPPPQSRREDERLVYGAKTDSVEMMHEVLEGQEEFDVNWQDGLGNTGVFLSPYWL
jgi:hypothetical protein